jgi:hypothetical protein
MKLYPGQQHFAPMQTVFPPSMDSIFGDTWPGVPNPNVPHIHPWPTRYHGPNYTTPDVANMQYRYTPYARAPFVGFGDTPPLFQHVTGSGLLDGVLGAAIGYVFAKKDERLPWMVGGALAGYAAGFLGLTAVGLGGYVMHQERRRRV